MRVSRTAARAIVGGLVGLPVILFWSCAAYFLWRGYSAGPLTSVDASALVESRPSSSYLEVTGWARPGLVAEVAKSRPTGPTTSFGYLPLFANLAPAEAKSPVVVVSYLSTSEALMREADLGHRLTVRGVLRDGVAGYTRDLLERGGARLEGRAFTLDTTQSPDDDVQFGWTMGAAGLLLQAAVLLVFWRLTR
jgi:hypothetical protein